MGPNKVQGRVLYGSKQGTGEGPLWVQTRYRGGSSVGPNKVQGRVLYGSKQGTGEGPLWVQTRYRGGSSMGPNKVQGRVLCEPVLCLSNYSHGDILYFKLFIHG